MEEYNSKIKQMIGNDEEVAVVYRTTDYSKFKKLEGNRGIADDRVNKIKASLNKVGYILNPLIINEKFEIIDGQGRLETFKEMSIPVDYVIAEGKGIDECIAMNINQTNWKLIDYIKSYADRGDKYYIKMLNLINNYKSFDVNEITCALMGWQKATATNIKDGSINFTDEAYFNAIKKLDSAYDLYTQLSEKGMISQINEYGTVKTLLRVFMICLDLPEIDGKRLKKVIIDKIVDPRVSSVFKDEESCADVLEKVYNYKSSYRVNIGFLYRERLRIRKLEKEKEYREAKNSEKDLELNQDLDFIDTDILSKMDISVVKYLNDTDNFKDIYNRAVSSMEVHKKYFNYCIVNRLKPLPNIPFYSQLDLAGFDRIGRAPDGGVLFYKKSDIKV